MLIIASHMKYQIFKALSSINRAVLPKIYKRPDLARLTKIEMAIAGWKRWVTFNYLDAKEANQKK